jgi:hypothetical protein
VIGEVKLDDDARNFPCKAPSSDFLVLGDLGESRVIRLTVINQSKFERKKRAFDTTETSESYLFAFNFLHCHSLWIKGISTTLIF